MKERKILLNASMYTEKPGGVGINTREAYNELTKRLIAQNINFSCYAYKREGLKVPKVVSIIQLPAFLELLFRRFISLHRLLWNIFFLPAIAKKYDLVYSFTSYGSPFIKNQVITIHDLICFQYPKQHRFQYLYFKYILPSIIKACKKIVVISEFTKQDVIKHFKISAAKLEVIYCGHDHLIDSKISSVENDLKELQNLTGGKAFFFTAGASYSHKNVDRLIKAMQALPAFLLLVTGPKSAYYNQLKNMAAENNYSNIIFLNYVSDSFLKLLYQKCVANVYISSYEGFGSTPLEAAMNNKISVIANKSVLPEIYGDSMVYVNPDSMDEIIKALKTVASPEFDSVLYKDKFPSLINKYSWSKMADGIINIILDCLNNKLSRQPLQVQ